MKIIEIEKKAEQMIKQETDERKAMADRVANAKAKLDGLINEALKLVTLRDFDRYTENAEEQRKQKSIIELANRIEEDGKSPERIAENGKMLTEFVNEAQKAVDEETAKDFEELEKKVKEAGIIAKRIEEKADRANNAKTQLSACFNNTVVTRINYPKDIVDEVTMELPRLIERWKKDKN